MCIRDRRKLVERCIPENKRTEAMVDACLDDFRTAYNERMMNRTQPYDGILPLLKALKKAGVDVYKRQYTAAQQTTPMHGVQFEKLLYPLVGGCDEAQGRTEGDH